jgi:hypothetical protein
MFRTLTTCGGSRRYSGASSSKGASEIICPSSVVVLDAIRLLGSDKSNYAALVERAARERGVNQTRSRAS